MFFIFLKKPSHPHLWSICQTCSASLCLFLLSLVVSYTVGPAFDYQSNKKPRTLPNQMERSIISRERRGGHKCSAFMKPRGSESAPDSFSASFFCIPITCRFDFLSLSLLLLRRYRSTVPECVTHSSCSSYCLHGDAVMSCNPSVCDAVPERPSRSARLWPSTPSSGTNADLRLQP